MAQVMCIYIYSIQWFYYIYTILLGILSNGPTIYIYFDLTVYSIPKRIDQYFQDCIDSIDDVSHIISRCPTCLSLGCYSVHGDLSWDMKLTIRYLGASQRVVSWEFKGMPDAICNDYQWLVPLWGTCESSHSQSENQCWKRYPNLEEHMYIYIYTCIYIYIYVHIYTLYKLYIYIIMVHSLQQMGLHPQNALRN